MLRWIWMKAWRHMFQTDKTAIYSHQNATTATVAIFYPSKFLNHSANFRRTYTYPKPNHQICCFFFTTKFIRLQDFQCLPILQLDRRPPSISIQTCISSNELLQGGRLIFKLLVQMESTKQYDEILHIPLHYIIISHLDVLKAGNKKIPCSSYNTTWHQQLQMSRIWDAKMTIARCCATNLLTPPKTSMASWKIHNLKMYFPLKMAIFHCQVSFRSVTPFCQGFCWFLGHWSPSAVDPYITWSWFYIDRRKQRMSCPMIVRLWTKKYTTPFTCTENHSLTPFSAVTRGISCRSVRGEALKIPSQKSICAMV